MRLVWLALTSALACSCGSVNGGSSPGGCIASSTYATTYTLGIRDSNTSGGAGDMRIAQSFLVPGAAGKTQKITDVSLPLYYTGTPQTATLTLTISEDAS